MVNRALAGLDLPALDLVIIENVGNLVCPAGIRMSANTPKPWCTRSPKVRTNPEVSGDVPSVDVVLLNKIDLAALRTPMSTPTSPGSGGQPERDRTARQCPHRGGHGRLVRLAASLVSLEPHREDAHRRRAAAARWSSSSAQ